MSGADAAGAAAPGSPLPVVLDVDTGVDDALVLIHAVASPLLDLRAVTCVGGNTGLAQVLANTQAVLAVAGASHVPVHAGHARPRSGPVAPADAYHGVDGLLGLRPDLAVADVAAEHAVVAVRRLVETSGTGLVLVPLGPQTNAADLALRHPDSFARLSGVHFMGGGGTGGNVTAAAESNVHADPESADAVLRAATAAGVAVAMYGLDVFGEVVLGGPDVDRLLAAAHPALRLAGELCRASAGRGGSGQACLGDAGAVAALVRPDLLRAVTRDVAVETGRGPARGMTVVDRRPGGGRDVVGSGTPVQVFEQVDGRALASRWLGTLFSAFG